MSVAFVGLDRNLQNRFRRSGIVLYKVKYSAFGRLIIKYIKLWHIACAENAIVLSGFNFHFEQGKNYYTDAAKDGGTLFKEKKQTVQAATAGFANHKFNLLEKRDQGGLIPFYIHI